MLSIIFMIVARMHTTSCYFSFLSRCNATVSTNSKQVGLRHSRCINMFYFSGLSFRDTQRVWVFWVWVFETPEGLSFLGLSFRDTQGSEFFGLGLSFLGLSFRDTRGSEFFGFGVWVLEVWVFETPSEKNLTSQPYICIILLCELFRFQKIECKHA